MIPTLLLALWAGILALQLADIVLTASRLPQLSAFAAVRAELIEVEGQRLTTEQLEAYREQIAELDARESARAIPAGRGANEHLWKASFWRLIPTLLTLFVLVVMTLTVPVASSWYFALVPLFPIISYVLALAAARASVAAASARTAVHEAQREEIEEVLDRVSRASRKRVAGLGDRVTRALAILREQQGS